MPKLSVKLSLVPLALGVAIGTTAHAQNGAGDGSLDELLGSSSTSDQSETAPTSASQPESGADAGDPPDLANTEGVDADEPEPEADVAPTRRRATSRMVEEIVVTAQKRAQSLQDVPTSVTAFTGGQLDAQGVSDLKDLQLVTPGLTFDSMASYSIIFIRGVGGDAFQAAVDSSVSTYIDGLYLPFTFSSAQALGDVRQVEVLKGPQGTLYGRNAVAGAILVELKEPSFDEYQVNLFQQFGNYNDSKTKAAVSGPVPGLDNVAFSLSGLYQDHDAYSIYKPDPSQKYLPYRNKGFRAALQWDPFDSLSLKGSYYHLESQDSDSVVTVLLDSSPVFAAITTPITEPHQSGNNTNVGVRGKTRILSLVAESDYFDAFSSKLVYGHTNALSNIFFDFDSAPEPILDISALPNTAVADSLELILNSESDFTPDWLQWTAGAYYEDSTKTGRYPITVDAVAVGVGVVDALFPNSDPVCGLLMSVGLDCNDNPTQNQNPLVQIPLDSGIDTEHYSIYGQLTFSVTDRLDIVAGGRASTETRDLTYSRVQLKLLDVPLLGDTEAITLVSYTPQSHTWDSFTPSAGLNFQWTDNILAYYRYAEAFKSGNYNGLNINNPPLRVEPELATSHEIGIKSTLLEDGSLTFNAAIFRNHVENAQVQILALLSGGVTRLQNAAAYTIYGGEIEANWFALDGLLLSLSAVYLDGSYDSFIGEGFNPVTGLNIPGQDFAGNDTVRTPEVTGTAPVSYTFPFFFGLDAEFGADAYYNDGFYYDPLNSITQDAYTIYNARFGLFDPESNIRVTLYGKNLTDDVFFTQKYRFDFGETGIYGAPRTYGVSVQWDYGG